MAARAPPPAAPRRRSPRGRSRSSRGPEATATGGAASAEFVYQISQLLFQPVRELADCGDRQALGDEQPASDSLHVLACDRLHARHLGLVPVWTIEQFGAAE